MALDERIEMQEDLDWHGTATLVGRIYAMKDVLWSYAMSFTKKNSKVLPKGGMDVYRIL